MKGFLGLRWIVGKASGGTENVDDEVLEERKRGVALSQRNVDDEKKQNSSPNITRRKRPRSDDHPITTLFYAIRPGSVIEDPVIFFGVKEFDFFVLSVKEKFAGVQEATSLNTRTFHKLADALAFVNFQEDTIEDMKIPQTTGKRRKAQHQLIPREQANNNTTLKPPPQAADTSPTTVNAVTTSEIDMTKPASAAGSTTTKSSKFKVQWTVVSQEAAKPQGGNENPISASDVTQGAQTTLAQLSAATAATSTTTTMAEASQMATASQHVKDKPEDSFNNDNKNQQGLKPASLSSGGNNDKPLLENRYDESEDDDSYGFVMADDDDDDDDDDSKSQVGEELHEFLMTQSDAQATTDNKGEAGLAGNSIGQLADETNHSEKEEFPTLSSTTTTLPDAQVVAEHGVQADDSSIISNRQDLPASKKPTENKRSEKPSSNGQDVPAAKQPTENKRTEEPSPLVTTHRIDATRHTTKPRTTWIHHSTKKAPPANAPKKSRTDSEAARKIPPKEPAIRPHKQNYGPSSTLAANASPPAVLMMNASAQGFPNWRPDDLRNNMNYTKTNTMTAAAPSQGLPSMLAAIPQTWKMNMMGGGGMPPQLSREQAAAALWMTRQVSALGGLHPNNTPVGQLGVHPNNHHKAGRAMLPAQQNNYNVAAETHKTATSTENTAPADQGIARRIHSITGTAQQKETQHPAARTNSKRTETHDRVVKERKVSSTQQANQRWNEKFALLQEYKKEHGDFSRIVYHGSKEEKYQPLIAFCNNLRKHLRAYEEDPTQKWLRMTAAKRQQLIDLGFDASTEEKTFSDGEWENYFDLLKQYKEEYGDCNVGTDPNQDEKYNALLDWVKMQRTKSRRNMMANVRRQRLLDLGFSFTFKPKSTLLWEERFELLKEYKEEYGDCNVGTDPNQDKKYNVLLGWVKMQRSAKSRRHKMASERRQRLLDLGFSFTFNLKSTLIWERRFELLKEFKEEYGDCNSPMDNPDLNDKYKPLSTWLKIQRNVLRARKAGTRESIKLVRPGKSKYEMTEEQEKRLLDLGFIVPPPRQEVLASNFDVAFQKNFDQLKAFKAKHGNLDMPCGSPLYGWQARMRRHYADLREGKSSPLKLEHLTKLTSLGVRMTIANKQGRKEQVEEYVDFVKVHGRFPSANGKDLDECRLAGFATKLRYVRRLHSQGITTARKFGKTELPQELIEALDSVGFRWKTKEVKRSTREYIPWEIRFAMLKAYKEKHGHCDPPKRHPKLGMFCRHQRRQYRNMVEGKHSVMSVDRFRKLSEIGFRFKTRDPKLARLRYVDGDSSGYDTEDEKPANEENEPNEDVLTDPRLKEIETNLNSETEEETVDRNFFEEHYAGGSEIVQFPETVATPAGVRFDTGKSPRFRHLNDMTP